MTSDYSGENRYNPSSDRAQLGEAFESIVQRQLSQHVNGPVQLVWDYLQNTLHIQQHSLAREAKKYGDLTFVMKGCRIFVECCLFLTNYPKICDDKRISFVGKNKYYCFGVRDPGTKKLKRICYIPSFVMTKYLEKCPLGSRDGWKYRTFGAHLIGDNIRKSAQSTEDFVKIFLR